MELIRRLYEPDVAVLPIGDHFTMGPQRGGGRARAARREALRAVPLRHVPAPDRDAATSCASSRRTSRSLDTEPGETIDAVRERWFGATGRRVPGDRGRGRARRSRGRSSSTDVGDDERAARGARAGHGRSSCARATAEGVRRRSRGRRSRASLVRRAERELLELDLTEAHVWLTASSRRTRSSRATSRRASGASPTQSKFLAVGSVVPWAEPHVGAVATQSYANPRYGPDGLALLREGLSAEEVVERLTAADDGRDQRQLGVVDAQGRGATFTGSGCHDWAGGRTGAGYAAQGNILVSGATVDALAETFEASRATARRAAARLPRRRAGRRRRPARPAVRGAARRREGRRLRRAVGHVVDLRVDDHERPIEELRRLYGIHQQLFGKTPREEWLAGRRRAARASCASASGGSGYESAAPSGRASRTSRSGWTATTRSIRSSSKS